MRFKELRIENGELLELRIENGKWRIWKNFVILSEMRNIEFDLEVGEICGI